MLATHCTVQLAATTPCAHYGSGLAAAFGPAHDELARPEAIEVHLLQQLGLRHEAGEAAKP